MPNYTKNDILELVRDNDIHFIRLQFTDVLGTMKNVAITARQLERALDNQIMFDGSSIDGFARIEESDMRLFPDLSSFAVLPWRPQQGRVARLICDVHLPDGAPFEGDPRRVLKRAVAEAEQMGYQFNLGPELEFFLLNTDDQGHPTTHTQDNAGYFDLGPVDLGENARRNMCLNLEEIGYEVEASHHEVAPGQHEIDFKYADALTSADRIITFKLVVRSIAQTHGLHATFMPKPLMGVAGSGMHINMSLFQEGNNAFFDPSDPRGLSPTAYQFIAGLMRHVKGMCLVTNPLVNSYKRLVPGYEAPVYIAWSSANRSTLIRIPTSRGVGTRIELRNPDPAANPYLATALMLRAGLDGIKRQLTPPPEVLSNIFEMSEELRRTYEIDRLPGSLAEAMDEFSRDPLTVEALGEHAFQSLLRAKHKEWEAYRTTVHPWELERYLSTT